MAKVVPHFCLALCAFAFATLAFAQEPSAGRPYEAHLQCFRAIAGKTSAKYTRAGIAGFHAATGLVFLPDSSNSSVWFIFSEANSAREVFQVNASNAARRPASVGEVASAIVKLQFPGKRDLCLSSGASLNYIGGNCPTGSRTATPAPDAQAKQMITGALAYEIATMSETYISRGRVDMMAYNSALNFCEQIPELAQIVASERTRLNGNAPVEIGPYAAGRLH